MPSPAGTLAWLSSKPAISGFGRTTARRGPRRSLASSTRSRAPLASQTWRRGSPSRCGRWTPYDTAPELPLTQRREGRKVTNVVAALARKGPLRRARGSVQRHTAQFTRGAYGRARRVAAARAADLLRGFDRVAGAFRQPAEQSAH